MMKRLTFLKSLLMAPLAGPVLRPKSEQPEQSSLPLKVVRYQTQRGRPWLLFLKNGTKEVWFYWRYELEGELPPIGWKQSASCIGMPKDGDRWEEWYGLSPFVEYSAFNISSNLSAYVDKHFPDFSNLEDWVLSSALAERAYAKQQSAISIAARIPT